MLSIIDKCYLKKNGKVGLTDRKSDINWLADRAFALWAKKYF